MKNISQLIKTILLPSGVSLLLLSTMAPTIAMAKSSNRYFVTLDYGVATMAMQNKPINLMTNFGTPQFSLQMQTNNIASQFYGISAGAQINLSNHLSVRVGPEYDYFKATTQGTLIDTNPDDEGWSQNYAYQRAAQAFLLNTQLFFQPFSAINLSVYAGIKLGVAFNSTINFTSPASDGNDYHLSYPDQKSTAPAFGWNAGIEYQLLKQVALHAGFEQINVGATSLTQGVWGAPNYRSNATDINFLALNITVMNAGVAILF